MTAHCGAGGHRVTFEGDVDVLEEETHERTLEDRTAQTRTLQSSDHTSWVEGTSPYAESGVSLPLEGGGPQLYSSDRGARARTTRMRSERHLEYECEGESASTSTSASTSASPSASP